MTPLEERLQQALAARAELISHETVSPARPPAPSRARPGRMALTTAGLAAAATAAIVATVTFTSLDRASSPTGPAGTGGPTVVLGTTAPTPMTAGTGTAGPSQTRGEGNRIGELPRSVSASPAVEMRPYKLPAGSIASFRGICPRPDESGIVASKAFLMDDDHQMNIDGGDQNAVGAQLFTIDRKGQFAGSIAVEPDVPPGRYAVSLWCGDSSGGPDAQTELDVLEPLAPATDQNIQLAAHSVYPGEWIAFSGVCAGGALPASGWVTSPAFEVGIGHEFAGVGAAPFRTDTNGVFVGTAHVDDELAAGHYKVSVRCSGGTLAVTESLDIVNH
jgi:hypothetical protein